MARDDFFQALQEVGETVSGPLVQTLMDIQRQKQLQFQRGQQEKRDEAQERFQRNLVLDKLGLQREEFEETKRRGRVDLAEALEDKHRQMRLDESAGVELRQKLKKQEKDDELDAAKLRKAIAEAGISEAKLKAFGQDKKGSKTFPVTSAEQEKPDLAASTINKLLGLGEGQLTQGLVDTAQALTAGTPLSGGQPEGPRAISPGRESAVREFLGNVRFGQPTDTTQAQLQEYSNYNEVISELDADLKAGKINKNTYDEWKRKAQMKFRGK
jgi:hypothetical protein